MKVKLGTLFIMTVCGDEWLFSCCICYYSKGMRQTFLGRNMVDPVAIGNVMRMRQISIVPYTCMSACARMCVRERKVERKIKKQ